MLETKLVKRLLGINTIVLICTTFTVATLVDLILTVISVGDVGTTYFHLASRLIVCAFISTSLLIFRNFKKTNSALLLSIHFLLVLLFVILYTWGTGFFIEQHPNAMFYMVRSILIVYPAIAIVLIAIDLVLKRRTQKTDTNK